MHDSSFLKDWSFIKVEGRVAELNSEICGEKDNRTLYPNGILVVENTPIHFSYTRDEKENPGLELERVILKAEKTLSIIMAGRIWLPSGFQYSITPFVLELGNYKVPVIR